MKIKKTYKFLFTKKNIYWYWKKIAFFIKFMRLNLWSREINKIALVVNDSSRNVNDISPKNDQQKKTAREVQLKKKIFFFINECRTGPVHSKSFRVVSRSYRQTGLLRSCDKIRIRKIYFSLLNFFFSSDKLFSLLSSP